MKTERALTLGMGLLCTLSLVPGASPSAQSTATRRTPGGAISMPGLRVPGLRAPVELTRDSAGIVHIDAQNEHDLFFAQGYSAARDRMFQLELWRRQATGTMAEALGPRWVARDRASRLLRYRGDMTRELSHYHPRGVAIISAFADGVNAYVRHVQRDSTLLPVELKWLGITPGLWTPAVVVSRHNALASNAREEAATARAVRVIGDAAVLRRRRYEPGPARVAIDSAITRLLDATDDGALLSVYDAFKNAPVFRADEVIASVRRSGVGARTEGDPLIDSYSITSRDLNAGTTALPDDPWQSNSWVIAGSKTASGRPIVANDPHRTITTPSLRYLVHLKAPGWDVIGGGEPAIPGVAIGHNQHGAWGLTIFGIDTEDLYAYNTARGDARAYTHNGATQRMREEIDTIRVRGSAPVVVTLRFTRHGPVVFEDTVKRVAVALRAAWAAAGGAPYLASLRIDQARTWSEFRTALTHAHMPTLNWVWADTSGAIGWQAAGIAPVRKAWDGLVPVPGDGRYEWSGFLPIKDLPHAESPHITHFGTANAFNVQSDYTHNDAIARSWAEPWRIQRLTEVLDTTRRGDVAASQRLQHDETPMAARALVQQLRSVRVMGALSQAARDTLLAWNGVLSVNSVGAGVYAMWERTLSRAVAEAALPGKARMLRTVPLTRVVEWMTSPDSVLGANPIAVRDSLLSRSFNDAVAELSAKFGPSLARWQYGQPQFHHVRIAHPLDAVVSDSLSKWLSPGPIARGGYANTLNSTGNGDNQTAGASLRVVMDLADWERATVTNTPGQSGDPHSPHYRDLFVPWTQGVYAPLPYSKAAIAKRAERVETLRP
mgnify:CR=1 FL=1